MAKEFWLNLPVKDIKRSKAFFSALGFSFNENFGGGPNAACLLVGEKNIVVMLFEEPAFKGFTQSPVADTQQGTEVLLSFDVHNKEEVDEIAQKVLAAGGKTDHQPHEMQGWMYGSVFTDLDGHRWNPMYMDFSKMPKG